MLSDLLSEAISEGKGKKGKKFCPDCKGKLWPDMASCDSCNDYEADYDAMEPPDSEMEPEEGDAPPAMNDPVDGDGEEDDDETEDVDPLVNGTLSITETYRGRAAHAKMQNKVRPHIEALKKHLGHHDYASAVIYLATKVLRKKEWSEPAKAIEAVSAFGSLSAKGGTAEGLWKKALAALRDKDWQDYRDYGWRELEDL